MRALIDDLLLYSNVSQRPPEKEDVNLNDIIYKVLEDLELDIQEKKATFKIGNLPVVAGYGRHLQQLFQNLISNALKYYSPDISPVVSIHSKLIDSKQAELIFPGNSEKQPYHLIEVVDNGIGFEQVHADKIFQMFTRLHGVSEYPGTGVGLSIAQKVAENHQGRIFAESEPGRGSNFKFYLPAL